MNAQLIRLWQIKYIDLQIFLDYFFIILMMHQLIDHISDSQNEKLLIK